VSVSFPSLLNQITTGFQFEDHYLNDKLIEETNLPHRTYGLSGIKAYVVPGIRDFLFV
jgi:hypothetical protein